MRHLKKKSRGVAFLLSFFFGFIGLDRFYLGHFWMGMLKLFTGGCFGILWFVDMFRLATGSLKPAEGYTFDKVVEEKPEPVREPVRTVKEAGPAPITGAEAEKLVNIFLDMYDLARSGDRQAVARIAHFASRDAMDIDGLSDKTADQFYDALDVRDPADLYHLTREQILSLDGFLEKKTDNLLAALEKSRSCALDAFLFALGIPNVGRKTARDLASAFGTLDNLKAAGEDRLTAIPDVGAIVAQSVTEFFSFEENLAMIGRLLAAGVRPREAAAAAEGPFTGKSIVVTGTLPTLSRKEAEDLIRAAGGTAASSVSKKTAFVVAGEAAGSKLDKARALGIEVVDEAELMRRANP